MMVGFWRQEEVGNPVRARRYPDRQGTDDIWEMINGSDKII